MSHCPVSVDRGHQGKATMKGQDIFLLLKLVSLYRQETDTRLEQLDEEDRFQSWEGWEIDEEDALFRRELKLLVPTAFAARYTARGLEKETGISKSEVSSSLNRCIKVGLAKLDRKTNLPRANQKALAEFIAYGLKYVFPAQVSELSRGIPTSFAAPVLKGKIMSAGESIYIWPDAKGSSKGQSVQPLYKSVAMAVKTDPYLYEYLALVDAIRLGNAREVAIAKDELASRLRLS
jgi:hypothetical protein